jgi:hypothetical protein
MRSRIYALGNEDGGYRSQRASLSVPLDINRPWRSDTNSQGKPSSLVAKYRRIALGSSPSIGCIPLFDPFNRRTHSADLSKLRGLEFERIISSPVIFTRSVEQEVPAFLNMALQNAPFRSYGLEYRVLNQNIIEKDLQFRDHR